jgi:hypothetical protein
LAVAGRMKLLFFLITLIAIAYWFIRNASTPERLPNFPEDIHWTQVTDWNGF